ncbi:MAG TPA: hypothetical protein VLT91_06205, partial [Rhizomicrobium sp.]|nr:hypothetical protein [Rhizomicrobium sp.]
MAPSNTRFMRIPLAVARAPAQLVHPRADAAQFNGAARIQDQMSRNPFFEVWNTPFGAPPFAEIRPEHFLPAYERAFAEHAREIMAIAAEARAPTFENTIAALEMSGRALSRIELVFGNLASSDTNDELQTIERELAPLQARHWNAIFLNADL